MIQKFGSIENLYEKVDNGESELKGKQKENIENNRDLAFLSKTLGTINLEVPIEDTLENFKIEEWDRPKVLELFKELKFNRYIERFNLQEEKTKTEIKDIFEIKDKTKDEIIETIKKQQEMFFYIETISDSNPEKIVKESIQGISIFDVKDKQASYLRLETEEEIKTFKEVFEEKNIKKVSINLSKIYILLKQLEINLQGLEYDISIASYILNPTNNKLQIEDLIEQYLELNTKDYVGEETQKQMNLFDVMRK